MKTIFQLLIVVSALYLAGCVTTQAGGGTTAAPAVKSEAGKGGDVKMLTDEDYKRIGVNETGR